MEATPGDEVRAGGVVGEPVARAEDLRGHRRGRRLAVRRRDQHGALRQPRGEPVDRARIELPEELSGHRRAAAAACDPGEGADRAGGGGLRRERDR